jgi:molecular chaperone GrpE
VSDQPQTPPTEAEQPPRPEEDVADAAAQGEGEDWFVGEPPEADGTQPEPAPAAQDEEPEVAALRERAEKADEYLVLAQRKQAEFENFRKRMTREVGAAEARGIGRLAKELLPALDNLDRALAAAESVEVEHHLAEGIRLVQSELSAALARAGVEGFDPKGEPFDPAQHEAVAQTPVEGAVSGTVVEVYEQGYRLADTILRPARVVVAA